MAVIPFSQWKAQQGGATSASPTAPVTPTASPKVIPFSQWKAQQAAKTDATPTSTGNRFMAGLKDFSTGVAQSELGAVQGLGSFGQKIQSTLGDVAGSIPGVNVSPQAKGQGGVMDITSPAGQKFSTAMSTGGGLAQGAGRLAGTVAPYLTGVGEAEGAVLGAKTLATTGSKAASWLAEHIPTFAANMAIGTAQSKGDVTKGAESAAFAEVGQAAIKGTLGYIAGAAKRAEQGIIDAFTPRITGKGYEKAANTGIAKLTPPSIFGRAGVTGDSMRSVNNAVEALNNVATTLGKKTTDIISTGAGSITKNFNNITSAIGEYAQKHVQPFLDSAGVNYNFSDLRNALTLVKPPVSDLKGEALTEYNNVREQILNAVSNKVSPSVTGGRNLTELRSMATQGGTVPAKVTQGDKDFWDARKIIDDIGNTVTKGHIFNSPEHTGATRAWQDMRAAYKNYLSDGFRYPGQMEEVNAANDFASTQQTMSMDKTGWDISQLEKQFGLTPSAQSNAMSQQWDSFMKNMEGLYQGRSNISTGLGTERGKNLLEIWAKSPTGKVIESAIGGASVLEIGKKLTTGSF